MTSTTIVIVTSSTLIQRGLSALAREIPELDICAIANDLDEGVRALTEYRPTVLVIDVAMLAQVQSPQPRKSSQQGQPRPPRVLVLSPRAHIGTAHQAHCNCVCGFASERASSRQLRAALRTIALCPAEFGERICGGCPLRSTLQLPTLPLSERENRVFLKIGHGDGTGSIAERLGVSVKTIETYRESIKRKLGLTSAAALQEAALRWKWGEQIDVPKPAARREPRPRAAQRSGPPNSDSA